MPTTTQPKLAVHGHGTQALADHFGLLQSAIRRELLFAEAAGVVRCDYVGRCRVLPESQLDSFRDWLTRRGLLTDTATPAFV